MARAMWSGSISFGLVNIPVKLFSAISRKNVQFHQLDSKSGSRVRQRRISAETGEEVPWDDIVKGYELSSGAYVVVTDEELAALDPKVVRTIEIEEFVDLAEIDPIFYDSAYYLGPDGAAAKSYALLAQAMEEEGKVGIAHMVLRTKQYLAAIRPQGGRLLLSTMVYADEVNDPAEVPGLADIGEVEVSDKELKMARQLIESLAAPFEPERFRDTYREAVLSLIERKAEGEEVVVAADEAEPVKVIDLMAALEASVAEAKAARGRHPAGRDGEDATSDDEPAAKPTRRRRKSA